MVRLSEGSKRVATGERLQTASDDPFSAGELMHLQQGFRAFEQYRRNIGSARARITTTESVLDQMTDLMARAKELAIGAGSSNQNAQARQATAQEVDRLIEQTVSLGNTRIGSDYLFGGTATTVAPFQADGTYVGNTGVRQAEIGAGYYVDTAPTGQELMIDSTVIQSLVNFRDRLRANDQAGIQTSAGELDTAFQGTQVLLAETGARVRQLDVAVENITAQDSNFTSRYSNMQAIPMEEATVEMFSAQNALQASLAAASRVLNTSILDFLR